MSEQEPFVYTLNPDGSYMSNDQVVERIWTDLQKPEQAKSLKSLEDLKSEEDLYMLHHGFGMWMRNKFGMWRVDNPHSNLNPPRNAKNVIDHPDFPDQRSHNVLVALFRRTHPNG